MEISKERRIGDVLKNKLDMEQITSLDEIVSGNSLKIGDENRGSNQGRAHTPTESGASSRTVEDHWEESNNLNEKWKTVTYEKNKNMKLPPALRRTPIK
ncbi:hypothetical protein HHI36_017666 [Cryptolaemus montrouzieri]|uniref:Uncharacterized protein n=1 Tax=Cryptolaemus montrouzieri TaxID=559131 RepID=A0ABD2NP81_9CUCU